MTKKKPLNLEALRAFRLHASNIMKFEEVEVVSKGRVIQVEGRNGVGKTSLLTMLRSALSGARDAEIRRVGAKKGDIVLEFDGWVIRKEIGEEATTYSVVGADGKAISKPAAWRDSWLDGFGVNPVKLLSETGPAGQRKRLELFQEAMPMKVTFEELRAIVPPEMEEAIGDTSQHALIVIGKLKKALEEERKGINRDVKTKRGAVKEMEVAAPEPPGEETGFANWKDATAFYSDEIEQLRSESEAAKEKILKQEALDRQAVQDHLSAALDALRKQEQDLREKAQVQLQDIATAKADKLSEALEPLNGLIAEAKQSLGAAQAKVEEAAKCSGLQEQAKRFHKQVAALEQQSADYTNALQQLERKKQELAQNIPIRGVTLADDVYVDNDEGQPVPWPIVNTGRQIEVAVALAELRGPLIIVDGLESLDEDKYLALVERLSKSKDRFCVLARRRDDLDKLQIEST